MSLHNEKALEYTVNILHGMKKEKGLCNEPLMKKVTEYC
jgi:hypothetical protein